MSLTQGSGAFAGVHENGFNDFVTAFFSARPRYLTWGSPGFVPATTVSETRMPSIEPFGIEWMIELTQPRLDIVPDTFGFEVPPQTNQFALEMRALITVDCADRRRQDDGVVSDPKSVALGVCALGHLERVGNEILLIIDQIEIKDIQPDRLETVLECMLLQILRTVVADLRIPYRNVFIQVGTLSPQGNVRLADDQARAFANII